MAVTKPLGILVVCAALSLGTSIGCVLISVTHLHRVHPQDTDPMSDFRPPFTYTPEATRTAIEVYHSTKQGPPVILLHESQV